MRHRLPLLAASIGLVLGGTLAAACPASATTSPPGGMAQPGGLIELPPGSWPAGAGARVSHPTVSSSNWAGYAATGGPFTSVSADWTQPAATCTGGDQYAAFWVGLDGYTSATVEQTGTEADCAGRTAEYYAWWEEYPGSSVEIKNTVKAGDKFAASVTFQGNNTFKLSLHDITQGWTYVTGPKLPGPAAARSSAEVIAEAPSEGGVLPLTDFGTVSFTNAIVNSTQALGSTSPAEITMQDPQGGSVSDSGLTDNGENFSATYSGSRPANPRSFGINGG